LKLLGKSLDKGRAFTDWARPPARQAPDRLCDRRRHHLATLFPKMLRSCAQTGAATGWTGNGALADPSNYENPPGRLEAGASCEPQAECSPPAAFAAWRETSEGARTCRAGDHRRTRRWPTRLHPPEPGQPGAGARAFAAWGNDIGARLIAAIEAAGPLPAEDMPDREPKRPGLTKEAALVSDLLKLLLKIRAKDTGVAAKLIARTDELEALAAGVRKGLNILSGWRFEQFGRDALDLVEGRLAFGIVGGKLKMSRVIEEPVDA
jgi:ribonuclease D